MRYMLTVLSSGRPAYLERSLRSWADLLSPPPSEVFVWNDGDRPIPHAPIAALHEAYWVDGRPEMLGQCAAQARCWEAASASPCDWVFHVEDDVVLLRPLDLRDLAAVLDREPHVPQMALVRCPWGAEIEHGGYIPMCPDLYARTWTRVPSPPRETPYKPVVHEWIATRRNWANAPALFRSGLARSFDWPAEPGCETAVGPLLIDRDPETVFGLWGAGEPWVSHIGIDRAEGSHGY